MVDPVVDGLEELFAGLDELAAELQRRQAIAPNLTANEYKTDVQAKITEIGLYKKGNYRQSVHVEPGIDSDGVPYALTGTDRVDAKQHEFGGFIKAKNAKFLHFFLDDGTEIFTKQVYQPPHPHFQPVLDQNREKYQDMIVELMLK